MPTLATITLAAPLMLLGLGLLALPVLAHLLNRRARRRLVFPSVTLLAASAAGQASGLRLRRLLLLLLRCLAVGAVVLAFAQPLWHRGAPASGERANVVLLIDASASTAQLCDGISAGQALRAVAARTLDTLLVGADAVNLVLADARPEALFPDMTTNVEAIRSALDRVEPTAERADLRGAIALAGRMLARHGERGSSTGKGHLVILSDLQGTNWEDVAPGLTAAAAIPDGTRITIVALERPPPPNVGLRRPQAYPHAPVSGRPARVTVGAINFGASPRATRIELQVDDRASDSTSLTLEPRQEVEVTFDVTFAEPGEHRVTFALTADGLAADDRCHMVVRAVRRVPVTLVADDDPDEPGSATYFVTRALAPHGDQRDRYATRVVPGARAAWPDVDRAAVVFLGACATLPAPLLGALHRYMDRGGGVIAFCGGPPAGRNLRALDALTTTGLLPWQIGRPRDLAAGPGHLTLGEGDWHAPLLKRFDAISRHALAAIRFDRVWSVDAVHEQARVLLRFSDGTPALAWRPVGAGRLVVANFSPGPACSDLGKHGCFVALMQSMAEDFQPAHGLPVSAIAGAAATFASFTRLDPSGPPPTVRRPDGRPEADVQFRAEGAGTTIVLNRPRLPGFFEAAQGDAPLGTLAVNVDPRESDLRRLDADALRQALHARATTTAVVDANAEAPVLDLHGMPLWGWMLAAALTALAIEMALLARWKR